MQFVIGSEPTPFVGETGLVFMVPRGNTYSITNIRNTDARIFFGQARESRRSAVHDVPVPEWASGWPSARVCDYSTGATVMRTIAFLPGMTLSSSLAARPNGWSRECPIEDGKFMGAGHFVLLHRERMPPTMADDCTRVRFPLLLPSSPHLLISH